MPSQAYIEAVAARRHRFADVAEWEAFAQMWEDEGISVEDTADWVDAGVYYPQSIAAATAVGITPDDVRLLKDMVDEQGLEFPDLQAGLAIAVFAAIKPHFPAAASETKAAIWTEFLTRCATYGITFAPSA